MTVENFNLKQNRPTTPLDHKDPIRFSQVIEGVKDCFQRELENYFNYMLSDFQWTKQSVPTIEKYTLGTEAPSHPISTFTRVILQHPNILEKLPLVAITTATGSNNKLGFGSQFVSVVQPPARVRTENVGPYAFEDGDRVAFRTKPDGVTEVISTILFTSSMVNNLSVTTREEVVAVTKAQALYLTAQICQFSDPIGSVRFLAAGPLARLYPNQIEVLGAPHSTANALNQLGLTAGQIDESRNRPPRNRYQISYNLNVGLDIGAESDNGRKELTDLILHFLSLEMDNRDFTFYGRSVFDDDFVQPGTNLKENYQVILKDQHSLSGEAELPRQGGSGEQRDFIYVNRISIPVTYVDYLDREVTTAPRRLDEANLVQVINDSPILPLGDFGD